jgi:hypothetical protein
MSEARQAIVLNFQNPGKNEYEFLQVQAFTRFWEIVKTVKEVRDGAPSSNDAGKKTLASIINQLQYNTILIQGNRGTGKSVFLESLALNLKNLAPDIQGVKDKTGVLDVLDPTLMDNKEHILYTFLRLLEEFAYSRKCGGEEDGEKKREWREAKKNLAQGLFASSLPGAGSISDPYWQDALVLSDKLQRNNKYSHEIQKHIKKLVELTCEKRNIETLILPIDDPDMVPHRCMDILEAIRNYLNVRQLIIVVAGDIKLFHQHVRQNKYKSFNLRFHINDVTRKQDRDELINQLEHQYIQKLLPASHRIHLQSVFEVEESMGNLVCFVDKSVRIRQFMDGLIESSLYFYPSGEREAGIRFLLQEPIRTLSQLLYSYSSQAPTREFRDKNKFLQSLCAAYAADLYNYKIDPEALREADMGGISYSVFSALQSFNDTETGFYLRPDSVNPAINRVKTTLASAVCTQIAKVGPGAAIDYILKACASTTIYQDLAQQQKSEKSLESASLLQRYIDYVGISRKEPSLHVARHFSGILFNNPKRNAMFRVLPGVFEIDQSRRNSIKLDDLSPFSAEKSSFITQLSLLGSAVGMTEASGEKRYYVSVYSLLALVSKLLNLIFPIQRSELHGEELALNVARVINKALAVTTYSTFEGFNVSSDSNDEGLLEPFDGKIPLNTVSDNFGMISPIIHWLEWVRDRIAYKSCGCSSLLLGKVWTRMYYSMHELTNKKNITPISVPILNSIRSESGEKTRKHGLPIVYLMHAQMRAVLHAFLIEEILHGAGADSSSNFLFIARKNPIESDVPLFRALERITQASRISPASIAPIFYCIATCPLAMVWLVDKTNIKEKILSTSFGEYRHLDSVVQDSILGNILLVMDRG